jgi:hypothetical protein
VARFIETTNTVAKLARIDPKNIFQQSPHPKRLAHLLIGHADPLAFQVTHLANIAAHPDIESAVAKGIRDEDEHGKIGAPPRTNGVI